MFLRSIAVSSLIASAAVAGSARADTFVVGYSTPALDRWNYPFNPTPGTRIVANAFDMQEWTPDQILSAGSEQGFLWIIPAQVEGEWDFLPYEGRVPARLSLQQSFQQVGGTLTMAGVSQPLLGAQLRGDQLSFHFLGSDKIAQSVTATVTAAAHWHRAANRMATRIAGTTQAGFA